MLCQLGELGRQDFYVLDLERHGLVIVHANAEVKVQISRQATASVPITAVGSKG